MKKYLTFILVIVLTAVSTFLVTNHYAFKNNWHNFVFKTYSMEAFNEIHRINTWDSIENLLVKGCNKEALQYVRNEQSLSLLFLKKRLNNGAKIDKKTMKQYSSIIQRAKLVTDKGKYYIPSCN